MKRILTVLSTCILLSACDKTVPPIDPIDKETTSTGVLTGRTAYFYQEAVIDESLRDRTGITVSVLGTQHIAVSDSSGWWTISDIDTGSYTLQFTKPGFDTAFVNNVIINDSDTTTIMGGAVMEKADITISDMNSGYYRICDDCRNENDSTLIFFIKGKIINNNEPGIWAEERPVTYLSTTADVDSLHFTAKLAEGSDYFADSEFIYYMEERSNSSFLRKFFSMGTRVYVRSYPIYNESYLIRENGITKTIGNRRTTGSPSEVTSFIMP